MVTIPLLISKSSNPFRKPLRIVSNAPITIDINVLYSRDERMEDEDTF